MGVRTVIDYVGYLEETWLIFSIENYAARFAERESNRKYYFIDNGILNLFIFNPETLLLENLVAVSLYRMVGKELYFYNQNVEVDFISLIRNGLFKHHIIFLILKLLLVK